VLSSDESVKSQKIKISAVNYLNSKLFIYGLQHADIKNEIELQLDIPSVCAEKLEEDSVDIGLVPVAILPELEEYHIISEYCIGADGEVGSVLLLSDVPMNEIKTVLLDHQSRTSVILVQVLAQKFWKIKPQWTDAADNYETMIKGNTAGVVIGDRTFSLKNKFKHVVDLSVEWKKFTQLPFVFACWVSNKKLPEDFIQRFNSALALGLANKQEVIREQKELFKLLDIKDYFENKISFSFDKTKKESLELFLGYVRELMESDLLKIV
jgi:chorismate dehydratase